MTNFEKDLAIGRQGEEAAIEILLTHDIAIIDKTNDKEFGKVDTDFICTKGNNSTTLEVKNSLATLKTGNVFIEYYNRNNVATHYEGWLYTTAAAFIGFLVGEVLHIVPTAALIEYVETHELRNVKAADGEGYLLSIYKLKEIEGYTALKKENRTLCSKHEMNI